MVQETELPAAGTLIIFDGQRYRVEGYAPHVRRKDGATVMLMRLSSTCAECGAPFACSSPPPYRWLTRRCSEHKRPGVPVRRHERVD